MSHMRMKRDSEISSEGLAVLIVDSLVDAKLIAKSDFERAVDVAAFKINIRKSLGDYWCTECPITRPAKLQ